jgi:type II secretory pathway pseudopilin PulG
MTFVQHPVRPQRQDQRGYILLTLMLFVAMLSIAAVAVIPSITFQVKRDREEELIHRGVQYSRAIRKYYKKFGRYPTSLKDLDNTNNLRFLRQHYKDPITGKDFKLLHFGEVQLGAGGGIAGATSAAALAAAGNAGAASTGGKAFSLGPASQTSSAQGQAGQESTGADSSTATTSTGSFAAGQSSSAGGLSSQVFGGGPIVGVVSTSKEKSIREFNQKDHYNEWQFIYDPTTDRGGLLNTPNQPPLQGAVANTQTNPANAPGGFGAPASGFGSGTGSMGPGMGSFGSQPPAQNPPQQSQPQR